MKATQTALQVVVISKFSGLYPLGKDNIPVGNAIIAENCDLSTGHIIPFKGGSKKLDVKVEERNSNSLILHFGNWTYGLNRYYTPWTIGKSEILVYLDKSKAMKKVNNSTPVGLGQTRLGAPILSEGSAGDLTGTFTYIITITRDRAGFTDMSGPSDPASISASSKQIIVTKPSNPSNTPGAIEWNIYRMSLITGVFQFVVTLPIATTSYTDDNEDYTLGSEPETWYTSDQGNEIFFDKAPSLSGLSGEPLSGMIMGWRASTLYWNEPGNPDAWPSHYSMNFPSTIKHCIPCSGYWLVLTAQGAWRVDGTNPELLQQSMVGSQEPCIGLSVCKAGGIVYYFSDAGIASCNGITTEIMSYKIFGESYFRDNVDMSSAILARSGERTYVFHSKGVLVLDMDNVFTLSVKATGVYVNPVDGIIYYISDYGLYALFEGDPPTWTWRSGDIVCGGITETHFEYLEIMGEGDVFLSVYGDGELVRTKSLDFSFERNRRIRFPEENRYRAIQFSLTGSGSVNKATIVHT